MARNDPVGAFNFIVEIPNITKAGFSEVSGLAAEIEVTEYREGGDNSVRKLSGLTKYTNITFKRGITADPILWDWMRHGIQGNVQRVTITITLLNDQQLPVARWLVQEAWVSKYEGPVLNALGKDVAIESIEITHEGIERVAI